MNPRRMRPPAPLVQPRPFRELAKPRPTQAGLPSDLAKWYAHHEGLGLDAPEVHHVRIAKMAELRVVDASDFADPRFEGFRGLQIALSRAGIAIVYTLSGTVYRFGTVFAIEPGGHFILDVNHFGWMGRLKRDEWVEWGLARDGWGVLNKGKHEPLRRHFERLNPPQASVSPGGG